MGNCFSSEGGGGHHAGVGGVAGPSPGGGIARLPDSAPVGVSLNADAMMPLAQLGGHGRPSLDLGSSRPLPDPASDATPSSIKVMN